VTSSSGPGRTPWGRLVCRGLMLVVAAYAAALVVRIVARKYYVFLPDYTRWAVSQSWGVEAASADPTHVIFLFADHFEPGHDASGTRQWIARYRALADRHHDHAGHRLQHTWFYPGEQHATGVLRALTEPVRDGYGEVELHYHHAFDTADSLRAGLQQAIEIFGRFGYLRTIDGRTRFAFVHGNSGLDNSNGPAVCGVSEELRLLRELGAFADFTFPSLYESSQPPVVNTIYAAADDPGPKSYARPWPLDALKNGGADLMIFEGPLTFAPSWSLRQLFLTADDGDIHPSMPATAKRVDEWVRAAVHAPGHPKWVFVKVFSHGITSERDAESVLGPDFDLALRRLETRYNDGARYVLHYVTAREAYNIVRAAMDGQSGDPDAYRDWEVQPYVADGRRD
jgi:hypothetical protein